MKNKYTGGGNRLTTLLSVVLLGTLLNCSKTDNELLPRFDDADFEISTDLAITTAKASFMTNGLSFVKKGAPVMQSAKKAKEVDRARAVTDEKGQTLLHVITYKDNQGWAIIAGDERITPVLAYANEGTFDVDNLPGGVAEWLGLTKREAKRIKDSKEKVHPVIKKLWKKHTDDALSANRLPPPPPPYTCPPDPAPILRDDFLRTPLGELIEFGQGPGYNRHIPQPIIQLGDCSNYCGRTPAGCGPVAIAQIMTYFGKQGINKPAGYDFNGIPETLTANWNCDVETHGQTTLAMLLRRIYYDSNSSNIPFACTSTTLPGQLGRVFELAGYTNTGGWSDNRWDGAADLGAGFPLMMWGTKGSFNFNAAHIWVSSGVQKYQYYFMMDEGWCNLYYSDLRYMNWGWDGRFNGWFSINNMNPGGGDPYDTWLDVYKNIRP